MRAAELFWKGKVKQFAQVIYDGSSPVIKGCRDRVYAAARDHWDHTDRVPGYAYRADVIDVLLPLINATKVYTMAEEISTVVEEAANRAATAAERLDAVVEKFKGNVNNDLKSMKAVSDRVEGEVQRMVKGYLDLTAVLNGEPFKQAVDNAERMAKALEAIAAMQGSRISVALFAGDEVQLG